MPLWYVKLMLGSLAQVILTDSRIRRVSDSVQVQIGGVASEGFCPYMYL